MNTIPKIKYTIFSNRLFFSTITVVFVFEISSFFTNSFLLVKLLELFSTFILYSLDESSNTLFSFLLKKPNLIDGIVIDSLGIIENTFS